MTPSLSLSRDKQPIFVSSTSSCPFTRLPTEILERIVLYACRCSPPRTKIDLSKRSPLTLDIKTTLSLSLCTKPLHALISPLLFSHIRLPRPSSLIELNRTLTARPALGSLVKSLHVGTEDKSLPSGGWSLLKEDEEDGVRLRYPVLWLKTSFEQDEEERLPKWCEPGRSWCFEPGRLDCQGSAVVSAIKAALDAVDVEPYKRGYARSGEKIGLEAWSIRIHELQGCVDLYLAEMKHVEDARDYEIPSWRSTEPGPPQCPAVCRFGRCGHYPRLVVVASRRGAAATEDNVFELTKSSLWKHLTRRGSTLDQFDHPIMFARAELDMADANACGRRVLTSLLAGPYRGDFTAARYDPHHFEQQDSDAEAGSDSDEPQKEKSTTGNSHTKGKPVAENHSMVGLVALLHDLLGKLPNMVNLSVDGYLNICLGMHSPAFENLQSLQLGPLLPFWDTVYCFHRGDDASAPRFPRLENLRICGAELMQKLEAEKLAVGLEGPFPVLKRIQWEAVETLQPCDKPLRPTELVYNVTCVLQGFSSAGESSSMSSSGTAATSTTSPSRLIEVRLHPYDVVELFSHVLDPAMHHAWQHGELLPLPLESKNTTPPSTPQHRVLITESEAAKHDGKRAKAVKMLHRASRWWWEDCALLAEKQSKRRGGTVAAAAGKSRAEEEAWMPGAKGGARVEVSRKSGSTGEEGEANEEEEEGDTTWRVTAWRFE